MVFVMANIYASCENSYKATLDLQGCSACVVDTPCWDKCKEIITIAQKNLSNCKWAVDVSQPFIFARNLLIAFGIVAVLHAYLQADMRDFQRGLDRDRVRVYR